PSPFLPTGARLSLLIPRPARLTLFPYTTLFRSLADGGRARELGGGGRAAVGVLARRGRGVLRRRAPARRPRVPRAGHDGDARQLDRKSTRLNSSHEWISYAVFCLKKKTRYAMM